MLSLDDDKCAVYETLGDGKKLGLARGALSDMFISVLSAFGLIIGFS